MSSDITQLLVAHREGDEAALDQLMPLVYEDLRRMARRQLRGRRPGDTLETAGLINEAYLRLVDQTRATWHDRGHFFAVSATAMRQIIVDHARKRASSKRGGDRVLVPLDERHDAGAGRAGHILDIDLALEKLRRTSDRLARIVECRYFAGFTEEETAAALGVSVRTAQREWLKARAWLRVELGSGA